MKLIQLALLITTLPLSALAADRDAPALETGWHMQVNLEAMRVASDDGALYGWLEREVIDDLEEEFGEGTVSQFTAVTIFGSLEPEQRFGLVLHGPIAADTRERMIASLDAQRLDGFRGAEVYQALGKSRIADKIDIRLTDPGLFLAFGDRGQTLLTTSEDLLVDFQASGGRLESELTPDLLVIRTDVLLRGGVDTKVMAGKGNSWNSQIMRNIRRAGVVLSDIGGRYELLLEMVAVNETQAQALASIVQGLIGLQTLSNEDQSLGFLRSLQTTGDGDRVTMAFQITPAELLELLD